MRDRIVDRLPDHEVHVWYVWTGALTDPELLHSYAGLMSPEESAVNQRFVFERHRHEHLISHALVRTALSRYADIQPGNWTFKINAHGRPEIEPSPVLPPLRFNLSHTAGLAACAVTLRRDVGVDVEQVRRGLSLVDSAGQVLSPQEAASVQPLLAEERAAAFIEYWTLKEAYVKACGLGLAIPFSDFTFHLEDGKPIRISFSDAVQDDPLAWQFELFRLRDEFRLAVAAGRSAGCDLDVVVRETIPQVGFDVAD